MFEGIDGTGKGTQIKKAKEYLEAKLGPDSVVCTKDPGGTKLGACIRRIIYEEVPTRELAPGVVDTLFLASHLQNWLTVVKPAIAAGKTIVCDRWWYSQAAYMTQREVPRGIAQAYMDEHGDDPDLMILLHGDVQTMVGRARRREDETHQSAKAWDQIETLSNIQSEYFKMCFGRLEYWPICIDDLGPDEVWALVQNAIDTVLKYKAGVVGA